MTENSIKTPSDSVVVTTELILPNDTNILGNLLGGKLMHWIDIAAALVAMRHTRRVCVTASVDKISFLEPIKLGHAVTLYASVNRVFRTSMEIGVRAVRIDPVNDSETHAASAYLTFVPVDNYGKPMVVTPILPQTDDEKRRFEEAGLRREQRLAQRNDIIALRKKNQQE